jgi:hypothetical protein
MNNRTKCWKIALFLCNWIVDDEYDNILMFFENNPFGVKVYFCMKIANVIMKPVLTV